jgi:thiosulfate/3-mercaptopyruvate sulfurtransferase
MTQSANLLSAQALKRELADKQRQQALKLLDASWYLPSQAIDCQAQFAQAHILGAGFFDIDRVCNQESALPHMLPTAEIFAKAVGNLGIDNEDKVVVYDTAGLLSAARVWWMFKVFGHSEVKVLNGGLPAWRAADGAISSSIVEHKPKTYHARINPALVASQSEVERHIAQKDTLLLDARPLARFQGKAPEPRAGLSSGHMPGARCLPVSEFVVDGFLKPEKALRETLKRAGVTPDSNMITTCGSGITAAIITLALAECGYGLQKLYDGAWTEWASNVAPNLIVKQ